jgi:hypothetical protein
MTQYRVVDAKGTVVEEKEFSDDTSAYDWFKTEKAPDDKLGVAMEVHMGGEWQHFDVPDGGTNPGPSDSADPA